MKRYSILQVVLIDLEFLMMGKMFCFPNTFSALSEAILATSFSL